MTQPPLATVPMPRTCPFSPPAEYGELREHAPVCRVTLPGGTQAWALTRHEDIRAMLTDPRFSSDRTDPRFPLLIGDRRALDGNARLSLISMDPPEHGPARRAVAGEYELPVTWQEAAVRIIADTGRCVGAGQCALTDPAIFDQDENEGTVVVLVGQPEGEQLDHARQAVHVCPSQALSLVKG